MNWRAILLVVWAAGAGAAEDFSVETTRRGTAVEVSAYAVIEADYAIVWGTLTDYDRLAEFVPGMRASRIVRRSSADLIVEQRGESRFLFFVVPIEVTVRATARPPHAIDVRLLKGSLKRLEGGYRIEPAGAGRIALRWQGLVEPESLPPLLGELLMRSSIRDQFGGMVREIERREAVRRETAK
jgi:ribosome-associated toxin RatA of RatAB toxin-antitoxin module